MSIEKELIRMVSGGPDDVIQAFVSSDIKETPIKHTSPFEFAVPLYSLIGATYNFYSQDTEAISINLNKGKTLTFNFTANTQSFLSVNTVRHNLYRLDYETYQKALNNTAGIDIVTIQNKLNIPFYQFDESASGYTAITVYTTTLPKLVKPTNGYTEDLFIDKAQYFVDTQYQFPKPLDLTIGDYMVLSGDSQVSVEKATGTTEYLFSQGNMTTIDRGILMGTVVNGGFFTYFTSPTKPDINVIGGLPQVIGAQPTFSPIFAFKNVADGDYYKLQVNYDTTDVTFSGATTIFKISKQEGDAELVRTFSVPLTPNSQFLYRIGNVKEITNVFSIKQNVTAWSEYVQASTANDGTYLLEGTVWLNATGGTPIAGATIVATINGTQSNVDLGADSTTDPNILSELTTPLGGAVGGQIYANPTPTNSSGQFSFGLINGGSYTITASHPSYEPVTTTITLDQTTNLDIIMGYLWGDTNITFSEPTPMG